MDCNECRNNVASVPYLAHEADMARLERTIRRLWISLILVILLLFGSNLAWTIYESQFEDVVITAEQSAETGNNYAVGGDMNGEAESNH